MSSMRSIGILVLGILSCSVSSVMIRVSALPPVWLTAARLAVAAAMLLPLWFMAARAYPRSVIPAARRAILPGLMLAIHFVTWMTGVRMVPLAHSSLIVNLVPVVMPLFMYTLIRERVRGAEWGGIGLATAGLVWLAWTDFHDSFVPLQGDAVCLISMLFMTIYLALGRLNRGIESPWLYIVPLYTVASLACLPWMPMETRSMTGSIHWGREAALVLGLGLIPTVLGHSSLLLAVRWISAQAVSLANLSQFVLAALWGYVFFHEIPRAAFYPSSALMTAGAIVALASTGRRRAAA